MTSSACTCEITLLLRSKCCKFARLRIQRGNVARVLCDRFSRDMFVRRQTAAGSRCSPAPVMITSVMLRWPSISAWSDEPSCGTVQLCTNSRCPVFAGCSVASVQYRFDSATRDVNNWSTTHKIKWCSEPIMDTLAPVRTSKSFIPNCIKETCVFPTSGISNTLVTFKNPYDGKTRSD